MRIYGQHDDETKAQLQRCLDAEDGAIGVLCADGHRGYSMPIGGVVAYRNHVSPSGVGYDIACGNLAVRTNIDAHALSQRDWSRLADEIASRVSFGVGRVNDDPVDSYVFDQIDHSPVKAQRDLLGLARRQLGTVGSGNHYVDLLIDSDAVVWVACHFGSRGFGHKTAKGFMNIAHGRAFDDGHGEGEMDAHPLLLKANSPSGQDYVSAMRIAGEYAYEGRLAVVKKVLGILGARSMCSVHNHHNYTWMEEHDGENVWVVRKGATPAFPGQYGFVGGSMGDISVVLRGVESTESKSALYSTVHGAGRVMSRTKAAGKQKWVRGLDGKKRPERVSKGAVDFDVEKQALASRGIEVRGAGADEAPPVYRKLRDVLAAHAGTIEVEYVLEPKVVVMAGADVLDPYKD